MQHERDSGAVPGALGLGQSTATSISNAFLVFMFLAPMFFGVVSDVWLGRYNTLVLGFWYVEYNSPSSSKLTCRFGQLLDMRVLRNVCNFAAGCLRQRRRHPGVGCLHVVHRSWSRGC